MATGDPFWCFIHKCHTSACETLRHTIISPEGEVLFDYDPQESVELKAHPECPSCNCRPHPITQSY